MQRILSIYVACVFLYICFKAQSYGTNAIKPADVLKRVLAYQHPLQPSNINHVEIPKKIWQIWKVHPFAFDGREAERARTWLETNPMYRYEVLTDDNDMHYVETHFGPDGLNRPDVVDVYRALQLKIIKADLLRYLVMYVEGGVYADIDVSALRPVNMWIPYNMDERDVDLIVGVEIDEPTFASHKILGPKSQSFCQWTFACRPRAPVMMRLVDNVISWLNDMAKAQNVSISEIQLNFDEVISGTGPSAFTAAIIAEMSAQTNQKIDWIPNFHNLTEPKRVGSILVLTVEAFAAGQGHSNSGNHNSEKALVKHHYHASLWPTRHQRYSHPAYGMVEECNWNPECVKEWDDHTAAFEKLSADEQATLIDRHQWWVNDMEMKQLAEDQALEKEIADQKAVDLNSACQKAADAQAALVKAADANSPQTTPTASSTTTTAIATEQTKAPSEIKR
ncbi:hypothetical protein BP6252_11551 [Coleophoma cylindrospora]|uniref:Glycosyltransferase family 32 protein n=1 Tax=Coleophoma cylindrospora TaxID=1849047 RepID=A0A3D8QK72_9HELO|nr:hypothetical protein BP6252_11551 [Coleophoma cylindrospora]